MKVIHGPRPQSLITPEQLPIYEQTGEWLVQRKFNGYKNTIYVCGHAIRYFNKGKPFTAVKYPGVPDFVIRQFLDLGLQPDKEYWFDGELLHLRVPHTIVLYDILQNAGEYFLGRPQFERLLVLDAICKNPKSMCSLGIARQVSENIWLAEHWDHDFVHHYEEFLHLDLIEGLVLRRKSAPLADFGHRAHETDSQIRCRKPSTGYRH